MLEALVILACVGIWIVIPSMKTLARHLEHKKTKEEHRY